MYDNHYFINRSLMYQYSFQQLCKSLNLKYKQMQIINSYETANYWHKRSLAICKSSIIKTRTLFTYAKNPLFNLIDDNFIGFPGKALGGFCMQDFMKHPEDYISDKDWHPNAKGTSSHSGRKYMHGWDKEYEIFTKEYQELFDL